MTLRCFLLGHRATEDTDDYPYYRVCRRCGDAEEDGESWFNETEWGFLRCAWWDIKRFLAEWGVRNWRCEHCGKRLWFRRYKGEFCSRECFNQWIPF